MGKGFGNERGSCCAKVKFPSKFEFSTQKKLQIMKEELPVSMEFSIYAQFCAESSTRHFRKPENEKNPARQLHSHEAELVLFGHFPHGNAA